MTDRSTDKPTNRQTNMGVIGKSNKSIEGPTAPGETILLYRMSPTEFQTAESAVCKMQSFIARSINELHWL